MLYNVHGDLGIVSAAKFMGYLWNLNQKHHFVDTEAFYNQVLCDNLSAKVDFFQWKNIANPKQVLQPLQSLVWVVGSENGCRDRFSFAGQHPYILNPETKSELLQIETLVNQRRLHQVTHHQTNPIKASPLCRNPFIILHKGSWIYRLSWFPLTDRHQFKTQSTG